MESETMSLTAEQLADLMPDATQLESNEPEMESSVHYAQLALLVSCLEWLWRDRTDFFIGANLTIYFSRQQLKNREFRGPDFFLVKGTPNHARRSWVVWEEDGRYPDLIIELLSTSTASVDRNLKKALYQDRFRTPEYFWFSPETLELVGHRLVNGRYEAILPNASGLLWSEILNLHLGVDNTQLRYFDANGQLLPTAEEAALAAQQQVITAQQQALAAQQRAEQLAEQLRSLGIEPDA